MAVLGNGLGGRLLGGLLTTASGVVPASSFTVRLSAASGLVGNPVTVTCTPVGGSWPGGAVITPASTSVPGTFTPASAAGSGSTPVTFTFTPSGAAVGSINASASPTMTNDGAQTYTATASVVNATAYTKSLSYASRPVGSPTTITFTPTGGVWPAGTVITPNATGLTGTYFPATLTPTGSAPISCDFTPSSAASGTLTSSTAPIMTDTTGALSFTGTAVTPGALNVSLSLTNGKASAIAAGSPVTIGHAFARGDVPAGQRVKMTFGGAALTVQQDQEAYWGDGSLKFAVLAFRPAETYTANGGGTDTRAYALTAEVLAPNRTAGFTQAAYVAANDHKVLFTGFDCGTETYSVSLNDILASGPATLGGNGVLFGWEVIRSGPNGLEWKAWSYLKVVGGANAGKYHRRVRATLYVRSWGVNGPHEVYAKVEHPNRNGAVAGGLMGPTGTVGTRFVCNATVQNGNTVLAYFGGPSDPRTFTLAPSAFNTSNGRVTLPNLKWLHNSATGDGGGATGFSISSTGALPGTLAANTPYWFTPVYTVGGYAYVETGRQHASGGVNAGMITSQGTGTHTIAPTLTIWPLCGATLADAGAEPVWDAGTSGTAVRPHVLPSYDQVYLTTKTKMTPPYDLAVTTYARTSGKLVDRSITGVFEDYSPGQPQPWGWKISAYGDDPGDERVGYFASSSALLVYQQKDKWNDLVVRSLALGFADYSFALKNEATGLPPPINGGPGKASTGAGYPGLGAVNLTCASVPPTYPSQTGPDFSGHEDTYGPMVDESHMPLLHPMAYLRTGHRIFLDEMIQLGCTILTTVYGGNPTVGGTTYYGCLTQDNSGQMRGIAWRTKVIAQASFMMPDADVMKPYYKDLLDESAAYMAAYYPSAVSPSQLATLGMWNLAGSNNALNLYQYNFFGLVIGMEAWRDAGDLARPQWKAWCSNYGAKIIINLYDSDVSGGGFYAGPDGSAAVYSGNVSPTPNSGDPLTAAFQTVAALWGATRNGGLSNPQPSGFLGNKYHGVPNYPFDTVDYHTNWGACLAVWDWAGVTKAKTLYGRLATARTTAPYSGIVWAQNGTDGHYDLSTPQSYVPWAMAPTP